MFLGLDVFASMAGQLFGQSEVPATRYDSQVIFVYDFGRAPLSTRLTFAQLNGVAGTEHVATT
jgi:hypothetical protein